MSRQIIRWPWLVLGFLALLSLLVVCVVNGERSLESMEAQAYHSAELLAQTQAKMDDLQEQKELVNTTGYVKALARQYDFIMPGELCFEIANAEQLSNYTEAEIQVYMDEKIR